MAGDDTSSGSTAGALAGSGVPSYGWSIRQHYPLEGFASRLVEACAELLYFVLEKHDLREADQFAIDPDR